MGYRCSNATCGACFQHIENVQAHCRHNNGHSYTHSQFTLQTVKPGKASHLFAVSEVVAAPENVDQALLSSVLSQGIECLNPSNDELMEVGGTSAEYLTCAGWFRDRLELQYFNEHDLFQYFNRPQSMSASDQLLIKRILLTQMKDVSKLDIAFRILMGHHLSECLTAMRKKAFKTLRSDHS